jgi:hypothetical protein
VLPFAALLAARGLWLMQPAPRWILLAMLLIPGIRFGRQYPILAADLAAGRPHDWSQVSLFQDSSDVAAMLRRESKPGETLFVWGYRPDVLMLTRMPLGDPYLDSQPINGVLADRHITSAKPSLPVRRRDFQSTWVVDGLGLLNPELAFRDPGYEEFARTKLSIVYRRRIQ